MNPIPPGDSPPEAPAPDLISVRCDTCRAAGVEAWDWYRDFPEGCPGIGEPRHDFERYVEKRCTACRWQGWLRYRVRACPQGGDSPGSHRLVNVIH